MLILDEIGSKEDIEVTEEEAHAELHAMAHREGLSEHEMHERLEKSEGEMTRLVNRLHRRKTIQLLVERAEVTEEVGEAKTEGAEEAAD